MTIDDTLAAFVAHGAIDLQRRADGPLSGLTFAVKDFFDVAGLPTGAGSPEWLATHDVPAASAPIVDRLLDAGARLVGKTMTDELAWSLNGENFHYGTPINPAAPGRIPGGVVVRLGRRGRRRTRRFQHRIRHRRIGALARELLRHHRHALHARAHSHQRCRAARAEL